MVVETDRSGNLADAPYDLFLRGLRWWSAVYRGERRSVVLRARRREAGRLRNVKQEPRLTSAASVENYDARLASSAVVCLRVGSAHERTVHPGSRRILARRMASFL